MNRPKWFSLFSIMILASLLASCSSSGTNQDGKLSVIATTSIVGDVVRQVGGDAVAVQVLIPANVDEHGYEPTPRDIAAAAKADLVFENGAGLEPFIDKLMRNTGGKAQLVAVSEGIELQEGHAEDEVQPQGGAGTGDSPGPDHNQLGGDPHVWMDPNNVLVWVDNIEKSLSAADATNAALYHQNAEKYRQQLKDLDAWVRQQTAKVPQERRKLVTDHMVFTYFAGRYGFEQVGAVVPGYSSLSAPSAQELARLEDSIRKYQVPAIFVGNTANPAMSERVAQDTGIQLVHILTGSLTDAKGPAPTYIEYLKYNVNAIINALTNLTR